ncbi:FecR family protein [Dysgonomonas sp. ZJ709]|uniref:FecR family protein n=1 Tax=Dysgonomonas sp. ZJ709 TaxID=2709797 RepID=UPI0013ECF484|nr:FecR domain-containing protein [Dysgonomonas sp. ZJ709]
MEKEQISIIISKYLSNQATQEEIDILADWIEKDKEHLTEFKHLKNIWEVANPAFDPDTINVDQAYRNINLKFGTPIKTSTSIIYYWKKIAAVIAIPLMMLVGYLSYENYNNKESIIYQEVFTAYGSKSLIHLPDSSKVWLNAGSTLKFPTVFKGDERSVHLQGEAFFEVESDKEHPFIVYTDKMAIKATGTAFNVEAYTNDQNTAVTLVNGKVNLLFENTDKLLNPGQRIDYDKNNETYEIRNTDTYKWCSWKDGIHAFRDDSLEFVFKRLGQIYNVEFVVKDKEISEYVYRATFQNESLDQILNLLQSSAPIYFEKKVNEAKDNNYQRKQRIEVHHSK